MGVCEVHLFQDMVICAACSLSWPNPSGNRRGLGEAVWCEDGFRGRGSITLISWPIAGAGAETGTSQSSEALPCDGHSSTTCARPDHDIGCSWSCRRGEAVAHPVPWSITHIVCLKSKSADDIGCGTPSCRRSGAQARDLYHVILQVVRRKSTWFLPSLTKSQVAKRRTGTTPLLSN